MSFRTSYANHAGIACHLMTGAQLKRLALAGTISHAALVGEIIRRLAGQEPGFVVQAILQATHGWLLARGVIARVTAETREGFDVGSVEICEDGNAAPFRIITQNENMIAWRGDRPAAMIPDLVCFIADNGQPLTNADLREGMRVHVLGFPAHARWREPQARDTFGRALRRLGYEGSYIRIEDLIQ